MKTIDITTMNLQRDEKYAYRKPEPRKRAVWTARCKSGFEINGHVCRQSTRRGALLCDDCLSAQVIPTYRPLSFWGQVVSAVSALLTGY